MKSESTRRLLLVVALNFALLFLSGAVIAAKNEIVNKNKFNIVSSIFIDGNLISSPQIIAYANQNATINLSNKNENQYIKLSLVAKDTTKNNIKVNYDFQYIHGKEKIHAKPEVMLVPNQESIIKIASESGHVYEMKVIAKRE